MNTNPAIRRVEKTEPAGWIGVDLDGTLAIYNGWVDETHIGEPVPAMQARVMAWLEAGQDVRIVTARAFHPLLLTEGFVEGASAIRPVLEAIKKWCVKHLGRELPIQCWKDYGMISLWDDRCVRVEPNTGEVS